MRALFILFACLGFITSNNAQQSNDIKQAIITEAIFEVDNQFTISWLPKVGVSSYTIQYRTDLNGFWQVEATGVVDSFYVFTEPLDYPVEISINSESGDFSTGYILVGEDFFEQDFSEKMLLIVTDSIFMELETLIEDYRTVLSRELINSEIIVVNQDDNVIDIKDQIDLSNSEEPLDYVLLLGHVPVPYAGNYAIDGHTPDHEGAWVADGFYGDLDGAWTDNVVDNIQATREANRNIPGDGKFDQTFFPSDIEIPVGRVDFSDLPKLLQSEVELTSRYILRNMAYRQGMNKATRRAVIDNNFNLAEGFAQGAIKSYHTFLEPDSINYGDFSQCTSQDYLFTFGAGGGNYQGASGIINTNTLVNDSIQSVFTTIFGSYFGDWDISNNLLRAGLARGTSLITAWSGRPVWYFHHMAMGKPVGNVLLNTQNNNGNYISTFGKKGCHTTLLGDPSLKMYYHESVDNIMIGSEQVSWEYLSGDSEVVAYTIYYKENEEWKLIGEGPRTEPSVNLSEIPIEGSVQLLIRPVGLIESRSGSYYNEGIGEFVELTVTNTKEYENEFTIYPNPVYDVLIISGMEEIDHAAIYNMQGQLVITASNTHSISTKELNPGMYSLIIGNQVARFAKL